MLNLKIPTLPFYEITASEIISFFILYLELALMFIF
jgi:hypothetical protein